MTTLIQLYLMGAFIGIFFAIEWKIPRYEYSVFWPIHLFKWLKKMFIKSVWGNYDK